MTAIATLAGFHSRLVDSLRPADGLPALLMRLYLAPVMIQAGWMKFAAFESTAAWLGNRDWGLSLPLPQLMAFLAATAELIGGLALVIGLATRWVAVPLIVTMLVAVFAVHWENGWLAIADGSSWLANDRVMEAAERRARAIEILREHGDYAWLTGRGSITVLDNGIEFAASYLVMLVSLLFIGGGRYTSADYWIARMLARRCGRVWRQRELTGGRPGNDVPSPAGGAGRCGPTPEKHGLRSHRGAGAADETAERPTHG